LNKYNIKFQDQTLSVSEIKKDLSECYFSFLELVLDPNVSDLGLTDQNYVKQSKVSEFNQEKPDDQIAADELVEDGKCFSRCSSNQSLSGDYLYPLTKRVKES